MGNDSSKNKPRPSAVSSPRNVPNNALTTASSPRRARKIDFAVDACTKFVTNVMAGQDRVAISTFNNKYNLHQDFSSSEYQVKASLNRLRSLPDGGTCLYDSIIAAILQFSIQGDSSRPWIMIVVTDGNDNSSETLKDDPGRCGDLIRETFNKPASNFIFVVGVGGDVNMRALQLMASRGGFQVIPVDNFQVLELIFAMLAIQISSTTQVNVASLQMGNESLMWAQVQRQRQLNRVPMDVMFIMDISGSMSDQA